MENSSEGPTNYTYEPHSQSAAFLHQSVLENVQSATIGSAAVKYTTEMPSKSNTLLEEPTPSTDRAFQRVSLLEAPPPDTRYKSEVCRDYTKGLCDRSDCKYKHDPTTRITSPEQISTMICKDYQNGLCHRTNCKFAHVKKEQSGVYDKTGVMTQSQSSSNPKLYRGNTPNLPNIPQHTQLQGKRPYSSLISSLNMPTGTPKQVNEELKKKLIDLRKQVVDLASLNDTLYNENQKYRNKFSGANGGAKLSLLPKPITTNGIIY